MVTTTAPPTGTIGARVHLLREPPLRAWWGDAVAVVVWASVLVVVALWVSHSGVQALGDGTGPALTTLGRLAGLVSADFLLWQVLAMARIPYVERSFGQDRLARWHRLLGITSVWTMVAHLVLITMGYAALDNTGFLGELWSLITTAPGMLLATAGLVLIVMVGALSARAARRRMKYESWHLLHLYAYLGVGLALPHQLWTGADFLASTAATVYWWTFWAVAAAAVLIFRVGAPLRLSLRHRLTVSSVDVVAPGVISVQLTGRKLGSLRVAAGQFFVWRFYTGPGWTRGHPLSLSAAPTSGALRITMDVRGDDGPRLLAMRPGTRVLIEGPHGRLTPQLRTRPGLALIGSGLGLAPLVSVLQHAVWSGTLDRPATLVRRVRTAGPGPFDADLRELEQNGWVRIIDLPGPRSRIGAPWLPANGRAVSGPKALRTLIPDLDSCDLYVCGAAPWAKAVAADARTAGVPATALHAEHFSW